MVATSLVAVLLPARAATGVLWSHEPPQTGKCSKGVSSQLEEGPSGQTYQVSWGSAGGEYVWPESLESGVHTLLRLSRLENSVLMMLTCKYAKRNV